MSQNQQEGGRSLRDNIYIVWSQARKNKLLTSITMLAPLIAGFLITFQSYPTYKTSMILRTSLITSNEFTIFIRSLQEMLQGDDYDALREKYFIEKETALSLRKVLADKIKKNPDEYAITIYVKDTAAIHGFENAIHKFFDSFSIAERLIAKREPLRNLVDSIDSAMVTLRALKVMAYDRKDEFRHFKYQYFYIAAMDAYLVALKISRRETIEKLNDIQSHTIVEKFYIPKRPLSLPLLQNTFIAIVSSLALTYVVLLEKYQRKNRPGNAES